MTMLNKLIAIQFLTNNISQNKITLVIYNSIPNNGQNKKA